MKLECFTVSQANITTLEFINEIINTLDIEHPTGVSTKSSYAPVIILKFNEDCEKLNAKQAA